jgi:hypothetical protein
MGVASMARVFAVMVQSLLREGAVAVAESW